MKNLLIKATHYTPEIDLNAETNVLGICGKSYPENSFEFYAPVIEWVDKYLSNIETQKIILNLELEYMNSSSLKVYFDLLDVVEIANDNKSVNIEINWIFDKDNDIAQETGEDFMEDFKNLNIALVVKDETV